jgi:AMP phosphorylase
MNESFFLKAKKLDISTGYPWIVVLHQKDAEHFGIRASDELVLRWQKKETEVIVDLTQTLVKPGEIGLFQDILKRYQIKNKEVLELQLAGRPDSIKAIQKKLLGKKLNYREMVSIVSDAARYRLSDIEIAFFVASAFGNRFSKEEIYYLTKAISQTGERLNFGRLVADKHSTGGLPGNRVTPIIVAIVASYGICIPKTSSKAITSAAGTADTLEVLMPVEFESKIIKKIVKRVDACLVWGGALNLAPADDRFVQASYQLGIEPYVKMIVSIMAKKVAMGITHLILDIPVGPTTKIPNLKKARELKSLFLYLAKRFKIKTKILIHKALGPVGRGIGPALEARDVLRVLQQKENRPRDLEEKSIWLAGHLLEIVGVAKKGTGGYLARKSLVNGSAWRKFQEIIKAQGGNEKIDSEKIKIGKISYQIKSKKDGRIRAIHNKNLVEVCRLLGAPEIKQAGIFLNKIINEPIKKGEVLCTLYTVSYQRLNLALKALKKIEIYKIK